LIKNPKKKETKEDKNKKIVVGTVFKQYVHPGIVGVAVSAGSQYKK
jgi:hypothetical protein